MICDRSPFIRDYVYVEETKGMVIQPVRPEMYLVHDHSPDHWMVGVNASLRPGRQSLDRRLLKMWRAVSMITLVKWLMNPPLMLLAMPVDD